MKDFFARFRNSSEMQSDQVNNDLDIVETFSNNIEKVAASSDYPEHLIAHGLVSNGNSSVEIRTAINIKEDIIEFSTNMGEISYTNFGIAIVEQLNHWFDGKFVTFYTDRLDRLDLTYVTSVPRDWLTSANFHDKLQDHASVLVAASSVLNDAFYYKPNSDNLDFASAAQAAQDIVHSRLSLHRKLNNEFLSNQYIPLPQSSPYSD